MLDVLECGNEYDALSLASDPVVIARSISQETGAVNPQNKFLKARVNLVPPFDRVDPLFFEWNPVEGHEWNA
jgi:hypothetical protein